MQRRRRSGPCEVYRGTSAEYHIVLSDRRRVRVPGSPQVIGARDPGGLQPCSSLGQDQKIVMETCLEFRSGGQSGRALSRALVLLAVNTETLRIPLTAAYDVL